MQALQLNSFLAAATHALSTVKSLTYTLPDSGDTPLSGDHFGLSRVPGVCLCVQHLSIIGSLDPALLQPFGATVTKFEITPELSRYHSVLNPEMHRAIIEQLHELFPLLKDLTVSEYRPLHSKSVYGFAVPYNLTGLIGLEDLDLPHTTLQFPVWASLPKNLKRLACRDLDGPPPPSTYQIQLQVLHLTDCSSQISLTDLAGMLRAVPALQLLQSKEQIIKLGIDLESNQDANLLEKLQNMTSDVLLLNSRHEAGVLPQTFALWLEEAACLLEIMQALPVLYSVSAVFMYVGDQLAAAQTAELLSLIVHVFPNMEDLSFMHSTMLDDDMLVLLVPLQKLTQFSFRYSPKVTDQGLTTLFYRLPLLEILGCCEVVREQHSQHHCVTAEGLRLLQIEMASMGRQISINQGGGVWSSPD